MDNFNLDKLLSEDLNINPTDVNKFIDNYIYSFKKIRELKEEINKHFSPEINDNFCIFLVGSYGRLEASPNSDLDCIFIRKNNSGELDEYGVCTQVLEIAEKSGIIKPTGDTGTFGEFVKFDDLLENIGGVDDTNKNLTHRVLILTESHHLYNDVMCKEVVSAIFDKYTAKAKHDEKDPRVLINELVRYYRTITIDYKYKTEERGKSWGERNFKLRHSRKLLFFTSIAIIFTAIKKFDAAECNNNTDKYDYIVKNINSPPILKLKEILVENNKLSSLEPFMWYNKYLELMSDGKKVDELNGILYEDRHTSDLFSEFKDNSDRFDNSLKDLIKSIDDWDDLFYKYIIF